MAQGAVKKAAGKPKAVSQRKQTGARIIKPKKPALIKQNQMKKVGYKSGKQAIYPC